MSDKLNPAGASSQAYANTSKPKPLRYGTLADGEIRVIHLHPGFGEDPIRGALQTISVMDQTPEPYSALSYSWGRPDQQQYSITLDEQEFQVRENLFRALESLRRPDSSRVL